MSDPDDPKGLIRESYRMEGIGSAECRSIFLDWALSLPEGHDNAAAITQVLWQLYFLKLEMESEQTQINELESQIQEF